MLPAMLLHVLTDLTLVPPKPMHANVALLRVANAAAIGVVLAAPGVRADWHRA